MTNEFTVTLEPNKTFPAAGARTASLSLLPSFNRVIGVLEVRERHTGKDDGKPAQVRRYAVVEVVPRVFKLTKPRGGEEEYYHVDLGNRPPLCGCVAFDKTGWCVHLSAMTRLDGLGAFRPARVKA